MNEITDAEWEDLKLLAMADKWEATTSTGWRENAVQLRALVKARKTMRSTGDVAQLVERSPLER